MKKLLGSPTFAIILSLALYPGWAYADVLLEDAASWATRSTDYTHAVAWVDVDRDGDLDLACANAGTVGTGGGSNFIYLNSGGVLDAFPTWESQEEDITECLAWGDVNQDGYLDLACGNENTPVRVYLNIGGDFLLEQSASWSADSVWITRSLAFADINGDGWPDLICGNDGKPNVLFLNHSGTLSSTPDWRTVESDQTWAIECGDVDRDGDIDLVVGSNEQPTRLYRNAGTLLDSVAAWNSDSTSSWSVALGDIDGDGWLDLVCGRDKGPDVLYLNLASVDSAGFSTSPDWISFDITGTRTIRLGDCDLDGDLDLALGFDGSANRIILNDNGMFADSYAWTSSETDQTFDIAWGDVNGDGWLDLACGNAGQSDRVYRNIGDVLSSSYSWTSNLSTYTSSVSWGDMNGDGLPDLACGGLDAISHVYLNYGDSLKSEPDWRAPDIHQTTQVVWADLDGIGGHDLICANRDEPNQVYYNVGVVLSDTAVEFSTDSDATTGIALGDLDGDGDLDLACANQRQPNKVYENVDGRFVEPALWMSEDSDLTTCVIWADVDRDGDQDLVCGNGSSLGKANKIYFNENSNLRRSAGWISDQVKYTEDVSLADPDGDGDLDLATGNRDTGGGANHLYTNYDGTLATSAGWASTDEASTMSLAWADVDGDGDPDLAAGNYATPDVLYTNVDGQLNPQPTWMSSQADSARGLAVADFDLDGDIDLACGNKGHDGIYANQLADAWRNGHTLPNNPSYLDSAHIESWDHLTNHISFGFSLIDRESDDATVRVEYSELGLNSWRPASVDVTDDHRLATSPEGQRHVVTWTIDADTVDGYDVWVRFIVSSNPDLCGTIQRPSQVYQMQIGRVEGKPRIAVLYPSDQSEVSDSLVLLGSIWDATNFSEYYLMLSEDPMDYDWDQLYSSNAPVPQPAHITSLDLSDRPPADYILRVICHDRNQDSTVLDRKFTLLEKPDRSPSVLGHFPPAGARSVPGNAPVVVWFDQNMNQSAINKQTFVLESETGERYSNALYDYKTRTLTIIPDHLYSVSSFHFSIVNSHFASRQGTSLGGEYVSSFTTSSMSPANGIDSLRPGLGDTDVAANTDSLIVHYGQLCDNRYVIVFTPDGDTVVNDVVSGPWFRGAVHLSSLTPRTYYLVRLSDDPQFDGVADYMSYFITEDTLMPRISEVWPADSSWLVALDEPITVVFNKEINSFSVDQTSFIVTDSAGPVPGDLNFGLEAGGTVVSFTANRPFHAETEHTVTLTSEIQDNIGNSIIGRSWTFTTGMFETIDFDGGRIHSDSVDVFFPQGALDRSHLIGLGEIPAGLVVHDPSLQLSGAVFDLEPVVRLNRPAVVTIELGPAATPESTTLVPRLYFYDSSAPAPNWEYHGGTVEHGRLSASIDCLGRYGVFAGDEATSAAGFTLSVIPRVISPSSGGDNAELRIAFSLTQPESVTIKLYSSSGRLVKSVASGRLLNSGENLLTWDGRDDGGRFVNDGLYILVVEAGSHRLQKTFVVINN